jgi:hypothetical protein
MWVLRTQSTHYSPYHNCIQQPWDCSVDAVLSVSLLHKHMEMSVSQVTVSLTPVLEETH